MRDWLAAMHAWSCALATSKVVILTVGGAAGTNARYWLGRWINDAMWLRGTFPWGTFVINVTGSFVLGLAAALIRERLEPAYEGWFLLLGTGFCGGYTTFSTFSWETFQLVRDGSLGLACANVVGSVGGGFVAVVLAFALVNAVFPRS